MKRKNILCTIVYCIITTAVTCLMTPLFFKNLGKFCSFAGKLFGGENTAETINQISEVLNALIYAEYKVPVLTNCVAGLVCGMLLALCIAKFRKKGWVFPVAAVLLLIQFAFSISFCSVNSISFRHVADSLICVATGNGEGAGEPDSDMEFIKKTEVFESSKDTSGQWTVGFGSAQIIPEHLRTDPLYIAGYNSGWKTSKYLDNYTLPVYSEINEDKERRSLYDYAQARAVWLDSGEGGVLLIGIDTIALSGSYVRQIREELAELCEQENCISVNVYSTHSHALPDTLGLWGPLGIDGKDDSYMEKLVEAAVDAGRQAMENRHTGDLYYGEAVTDGEYLLRDSRYPYVYDEVLHQLRFEGEDDFGVRMFFYGAHAESLRGDNTLLSRDFPGVMCDLITAETGDQTIFLPGAIGGLIMTEVLTAPFDAVENLQKTGRILADYALSILPENEKKVEPELSVARSEISIPLDNNAFMYFQFLGILNCQVEPSDSRTGYAAVSEMSLIRLGDIVLTLVPGEIFPELVSGQRYGDASVENSNPTPLLETAISHGAEQVLIIGLANDELGYIVPPSDFFVNDTNPYLERKEDSRQEDHYEETNSVGPNSAWAVAKTFEHLMEQLFQE